jgi:hypothetical protein
METIPIPDWFNAEVFDRVVAEYTGDRITFERRYACHENDGVSVVSLYHKNFNAAQSRCMFKMMQATDDESLHHPEVFLLQCHSAGIQIASLLDLDAANARTD